VCVCFKAHNAHDYVSLMTWVFMHLVGLEKVEETK
jgi:hypothetical protein